MPNYVDWIILGDFNLYCSPKDTNRDGADYAEMFLFNEGISALGLIELPLIGKRFTWSNNPCLNGLIDSLPPLAGPLSIL